MKLFGKAITSMDTALTPLLPAIASFTATFTALKVIQQATGYIKQLKLAIRAYTIAIGLYNGIPELATLFATTLRRTWVLNLAADEANSTTIATKAGFLVAQNTIIGVLTGTVSSATATTAVLSTVMKLLLGPTGWIITAIEGLVIVGINLWKWSDKETGPTEVIEREQENPMKTTDDLIRKNREHARL